MQFQQRWSNKSGVLGSVTEIFEYFPKVLHYCTQQWAQYATTSRPGCLYISALVSAINDSVRRFLKVAVTYHDRGRWGARILRGRWCDWSTQAGVTRLGSGGRRFGFGFNGRRARYIDGGFLSEFIRRISGHIFGRVSSTRFVVFVVVTEFFQGRPTGQFFLYPSVVTVRLGCSDGALDSLGTRFTLTWLDGKKLF